MARHVIDAPTLLHLVADGLAVHGDHQLVAPSALQQHERLAELELRLLGDRVSPRTAWTIAREQDGGTLEDAEHVPVARLQADALVAVDPAMAARCAGLVPLAPLRSLLPGSTA